MFPDPTFGGVLKVSPVNLTTDADGDGSPDLFGYSYVCDAYLADGPFYTYGSHSTSNGYESWSGTIQFDPATRTFSWYRTDSSHTNGTYYPYPYTPPTQSQVTASYAGTYSLTRSSLTLTVSGPGPRGLTSQTLSITGEVGDYGLQAVHSYAGAALPLASEYWYR